ncbi:hypothetical protein ACFFLS_08770 [Flavobacterium procerum]|uniref:Uncharacterized protein n=1 Tax=Flavobacterium procerum TaxID=1455569 RepID=A0ABV6BR70_9FLAO
MRVIKITILLFAIVFSTNLLSAQEKEEQIIKAISFEKGEIILNNKIAFFYLKDGNNFSISDLKNKEVISGQINSVGNGKFSSIITFIASDKKFSNERIIGRNDLIFALAENNVIKEDFRIDEVKLASFIEKYNQLK